MKLIIGLGNPDIRFDGTRHNVGFATVQQLAAANTMEWRQKDTFKANIAEGFIGAEKSLLIQPNTYYNLSGEAVLAAKQFYKLENSDILVIHDELALPFGTVRSRIGGTDAGNNGVKSVIGAIGQDFARIRIGIANESLPKQDAADFVLGHFSHAENQKLVDIKKHALQFVEAFLGGSFGHTTIGT
jgi:PTH1 family peptidyl-tRNA hydrolase